MQSKKLVYLDCDPGHDDCMAILMALHHPLLELIGIGTIGGNQTVEKTSHNALRFLYVSEDTKQHEMIQVCKGIEKPLLKENMISCPEIHGTTGLDGTDFPLIPQEYSNSKFSTKNIILFMKDLFCKQPLQSIHVCCTGPMTNLALLLTVFPEVKQHIKCICFMGGAIGLGNMPTPAAEWNIECDPEAVKMVLIRSQIPYQNSNTIPVIMIPLEVTHTALVSQSFIQKIQSLHSPFGTLLEELLLFFQKQYKQTFFFENPPLHDPCAIYYIINALDFETRMVHMDVETNFSLCRGRTVCDMFGILNKKPNVLVATKMNVDSFFDCFFECICKANQSSVMNLKK